VLVNFNTEQSLLNETFFLFEFFYKKALIIDLKF
jgi:hypothetical protein